ncbi:MAG: YHS domain-containing (seleno)protein [Ahrensia sp.]|nr:YHS domain-containing (seleno)protein [Ahrensia sp.]
MKTQIFNRRRFLTLAATAIIASAIPMGAMAAKQNLLNGIAIQGYDAVAYFTQNAAVEGSEAFATEYNGAKYLFSSAENRDIFLGSPDKYAPQYGGFCAYAVSKGYTAAIDPSAFSVVDNKLYLNYSKGVRTIWTKDTSGNIKLGNSNWPALSVN